MRARRWTARTAGGGSPTYLVIATGYHNDVAPGFTENAVTITTLPEAERAGAAWKHYLDKPGDVVVAASQRAGCFGAAYEFLFNTAHQLKKAGLHKDVTFTYVTGEPFLGHFGIGGLPHGEQLLGMFLKKEGIRSRISVGIDHIDDGAMILADGEKLPFAFAMVIPPFLGQDFLRDTPGLADPKGYVPVRDTYQSAKYDDIYAVGVAAAPARAPRTRPHDPALAPALALARRVRGRPRRHPPRATGPRSLTGTEPTHTI